jgi:hypothetical protein
MLGNINDNMCNECKSDFYPLIDRQTQCYLSNTLLQSYYFDNTQFSKCYETCKTCDVGGDSITYNCTQCASGYYSLTDNPSQCFPLDTQVDYHYFNGLLFDLCYNSCLTCSIAGDNIDHNCNTCKSGFYPLEDNISMCYHSSSYVPGYAYDTDKFKQCYQSCKECSDIGDSTAQNCTICKSGYYPLSDDNSFCYPSANNIPHYYYDSLSETFKPCFSSCEYCNVEGDVNNNNCTQCRTNYLPLEDKQSMCYEKTTRVNKYFIDLANSQFSLCYVLCETCNELGSSDDNKCLTCKSGYYKLVDNKTMCHPNSESIPTYYFDQTNSIFNKCYNSCNSCSVAGTKEANNCITCLADYYYLENDDSQCYYKDSAVSGYFFDTNSYIFRKCYSSCSACNELGTDTDMKCTHCNPNYYPLADKTSLCFPSTTKIPSYYFDTDKFYHCNAVCATCTGGWAQQNPQCLTCAAGYYPLVDKQSYCYTDTHQVEGYYYNLSTHNFLKCNAACSFCSVSGTTDATNCLQCSTNYYPLIDNSSQCQDKTVTPNSYYADNVNRIFQKCNNLCQTCSGPGSYMTDNCLTCIDGYALNPIVKGSCADITVTIEGYFYDKASQSFKQCYNTCTVCSAEGTSDLNNCLQCKDGFYPLENTTNCSKSGDLIVGYYFDSLEKSFKQCYETCKYCNGSGTETLNNCYQCADGMIQTTDNPNNCMPNLLVRSISFSDILSCYPSCSECSDIGDQDNMNCLKCAIGYYPLKNKPSQCYLTSDTVEGYYFDSNSLAFKNCNPACMTCSGPSKLTSTNCDTCNSLYTADANDSTNCIMDVQSLGSSYIDSKCYPTCATCEEKGDMSNHMCTSCLDGYNIIAIDGKTLCVNDVNIADDRYGFTYVLILCILIIFI